MQLDELVRKLGLRVCCAEGSLGRDVRGGYVGDLLSDVMAHAAENSLLITIQTHQNAIAVATLVGIRAILACSSRPIPADMLAAARQKGLGLYCTPLNQFDASVAVARLLADR
jgi:hypothetical protein